MRIGIAPAEYWELDQEEFLACVEGYGKRMDDVLAGYATLACWIVNNLPIPFVKNRQAVQPKKLLGKGGDAPVITNKEEFREYMKQRRREGGDS